MTNDCTLKELGKETKTYKNLTESVLKIQNVKVSLQSDKKKKKRSLIK